MEDSKRILDNNPSAGLAKGLSKAWDLYGSERWVSWLGFRCVNAFDIRQFVQRKKEDTEN